MEGDRDQELHIVTEVGTFGDLNIDDPTKKKLKKAQDLDAVIREATETNLNNLTKK
jgi:hypothetical protein